MRHMLPVLVPPQCSLLSSASRKIQQHSPTRTAFSIRIRIGRQNRLLKLFLDPIPLLFRRFSHVQSQNIMARFQRRTQLFQPLKRNLFLKR
jgi:hypothetical protein